jgi:hypothetical protein
LLSHARTALVTQKRQQRLREWREDLLSQHQITVHHEVLDSVIATAVESFSRN